MTTNHSSILSHDRVLLTNPSAHAISADKMAIIRKVVNTSFVVGVLSIGAFAYYKNPRAAIHEYAILPTVRAVFDAEKSHKLAIECLKYPFLSPSETANWDKIHDPNGLLKVTLFKNAASSSKVKPLTLLSPIGVAAGLDKHGEAIDSLFNLGFSYVEIGSVTPEPQPGNPLPRFFRLERDSAVINRYGFNSDGHLKVLARLKQRLFKQGGENSPEGKVLAVNLGKNKTGDEIKDYVKGVQRFAKYADVLVINVSSPNTPGLRDLQSEDKLTSLLKTVINTRNSLPLDQLPPLVVKIAPDLNESEIASIAKSVTDSKVDGVIVSNTTIERPSTLANDPNNKQVGGLSGKPLKPYSLKALKSLKQQLKNLGNDSVTLIGCGGVSNAEDALEFRAAGADFVELYTAFAYKGPGLANKIKSDLLDKGVKWQ